MTNDRIRESIGTWQTRLLDLGQRNRLLYFKPDATSSVQIKTDDIGGFLSGLEASRHGFMFDFQPGAPKQPAGWFDPTGAGVALDDDAGIQRGDIETLISVRQLQARLLRLRNKDREFRDEQGLSVLFLACGLLHWVDENNVQAVAPLLLVPCTLERASPRDPFVLRRHEDEALANVTLEYKLRADLGFALPTLNLDAPPEAYFADVESAIGRKAGWSVSPDIALSTFQYSKMAMWEDLEELKNAPDITHPLVRFLAGDTESQHTEGLTGSEWFLKSESELTGGHLDDHVSPHELPLVMQADFSQLQAIGAARTGRNLVIHGPPGTGKSQTIANLIGAFMADGKTVLFVSEKTAALDVVKRRLASCGLGTFCLDLHSERGRKANVYLQFGESLANSTDNGGSDPDYRALLDSRSQLNGYVRQLHRGRLPLGLTPYQVMGLFAHVRDLPDVDFPFKMSGSSRKIPWLRSRI